MDPSSPPLFETELDIYIYTVPLIIRYEQVKLHIENSQADIPIRIINLIEHVSVMAHHPGYA